MSLHTGTDILSVIEPVLLVATLCVFLARKGYRDSPAFCAYLAWRLGVCSGSSILLYVARLSTADRHLAYHLYYYFYWIGYLVGAGIALLVIQEVFKHLMRTLPGLGRYGLMAFRWVTVTSALVALAIELYPVSQKHNLLAAATAGAMRCMSILELCLLAFIALSIHTLRLSARARSFGISLGLAMIAAADLFGSVFAFGHPTMTSVANYCCEVVVTLAPALWLVYFLRTAPETKIVTLPLSSSLQRWNEIAHALGEPTPQQIALSVSTDSFLLHVEEAVDRVLKNNPMNPVQ